MIRLDQSIATSLGGARAPEPSSAAGGDAFAALFGAVGAVPVAAGEGQAGDRQAAAGPGKELPVGDAALASDASASDAQIAPILAILAEVMPPTPVSPLMRDETTTSEPAALPIARDPADVSSPGMLAAPTSPVGERGDAAPVRIAHSLRTTTALTAPAPPPQPVSPLTALPDGQAAPVTAPARAILPAMSDDMGASEREPAPLPHEGARRDAGGLAAARKAIDMPAALPLASPSVTAEFRTPSATGSPANVAVQIPPSEGGAARAMPEREVRGSLRGDAAPVATLSVVDLVEARPQFGAQPATHPRAGVPPVPVAAGATLAAEPKVSMRPPASRPAIAPASAGAKPAPVEAVRAVGGAAIAVAARLTPAAVAGVRGVAERASVNAASPVAVPTVAPPIVASAQPALSPQPSLSPATATTDGAAPVADIDPARAVATDAPRVSILTRSDGSQLGTAAIATPTPATTPAQPAVVASPASASTGAAAAAAPAATSSPSAPTVANVVAPATATAPVAGDSVTKPVTLVAAAPAVPRVRVAAGPIVTSAGSPERRAAPVVADRVAAPVTSRVAASVAEGATASPLRRAADPLPDGPAPIARPSAPTAPVPLVDPGASATVATAASTPTAPTPIDTRGPWIEAMIERIETVRDLGLGESGAATRIRLSPDALGAVEIVLTPVGDGFDVQIVADSPAARALLAEASPRLAEMASDRGWRLAGGDAGTQGQAQHGQGGRHAAPAARGTAHDTESAPEPGAARNWIA